jgi:LuxR family maltose regulon positive regulatory protein
LIQRSEIPPLRAIARTLINELRQIGDHFVLVLDDYHLVRSTTIHDLIEELLMHPSPYLHLVLGTRVDPPISLNEKRARSKITKIRLQDLRFREAAR